MAANSNIQLTSLDFDALKSNFLTYLQGQEVFKDYNFQGSALNALVDVLTYNTQYNAYYLNMVANEMFLDSAVQRGSVVSHAKLLNYTPKSASAPTATVDVVFTGVTDSSLTLPAYSTFSSLAIDGINYTFVNPDTHTVNTDMANNIATFSNVEIKQGVYATYSYTVNSVTNPTYTYEIPDATIDTSSLQVIVQQSSSNSSITTYSLAENYTQVGPNDTVYFLQEALNGNYQIYFGDGIIGKKLEDNNIVIINYVSTEGTAAAGANAFVLMQTVGGYSPSAVNSVTAATQGGDKETIDSIKFQAPKSYAAQNRAVTKDDYITLIQQNKAGLSFDAVNVWGGEENDPPQYGRIFVAVKPKGGYTLTQNQKNIIVNDIIKPISIMTVTPQIVDVDYVYLILEGYVTYEPKKTTRTSQQITELVRQGVITFCNANLNTFNSTFVVGNLIQYTQNLDKSIVAIDYDLYLQKRIIPTLGVTRDYKIKFGNQLENGLSREALVISPSFGQYDSTGNYYSTVYFEVSPDTSTNVDSITLVSGGSGYTSPTISISGDGTGAKATATVENGIITGITITSGGANYTQAIVTISDSTGSGASAVAVLRGDYGTLRTYYYVNGVKNILTQNAGTVDYSTGTVTLTSFSPTVINNTDGIMTVNGYAMERTVSSTYDRIITLDSGDAAAVSINTTAK